MSTAIEQSDMSITNRKTHTNIHGYREVNIDHRISRAVALDARKVSETTGRIACPMIDACRSERVYGRMALQNTDKKHLNEWAQVIGVSSLLIKLVAYFSGPVLKTPKNMIFGSFDDKAINDGFVRTIKNGVNTGILAQGHFSPDSMNAFVWAIHPKLKGKDITQEWLYSEAGDELYLDETMIPSLVTFNVANAKSSRMKTWLGEKMSKFEMTRLLVGVLAQEVKLNRDNTEKTLKAILLRDVYDFYKYGLMPAPVEEKLAAAEMLNVDPMVVP